MSRPAHSLQKPLSDPAVQEVMKRCSHMTIKEIVAHPRCWISAKTIRNYRLGLVKYPHHLSIESLAQVVGMTFMLVTHEEARAIRNQRKEASKQKTDVKVVRKPTRNRHETRMAA